MRVKKYLALTLAAILATTMLTGCPWEEEEDKTDDSSSVPVTSTDTSQDDDDHDSGDDNEEEEEKDPTPPEVTSGNNPGQNGTVTIENPTYDKDTKTFSVTFTTEPTNNTHIASKVNVTGHTKDGGTFSGSWSAAGSTATFARVSTEATVTIKPDTDQKVFTVTGIPANAEKCDIDVTFEDLGYVIEGGTYKVHNADGLLVWNAAVQGNMSLNCTLIDNIDLGEENWTPIGSYPGNGYTGTFDGGGYTISGLKVNGGDYAGLFGYVNGGTVENLNLEIASISGNDYVGGVVGRNYGGTIQGCMVSGSVSGNDYVGGIVGCNINNGIVKGCCFAGNSVTADDSYAYVGGVVGSNLGNITACCFAGDSVTGTGDGAYVGGVVGADESSGIITDCYWQAGQNGPSKGVGQNDGTGTPDVTQIKEDVTMQTAIAAMNNYLTGYQYELKGDQIVLVADNSNNPEVPGLTQRVLDAARVFGL